MSDYDVTLDIDYFLIWSALYNLITENLGHRSLRSLIRLIRGFLIFYELLTMQTNFLYSNGRF